MGTLASQGEPLFWDAPVEEGTAARASGSDTFRMACVGSRRVCTSPEVLGDGSAHERGEFGIPMNTEPGRSADSADSLALWALVGAALGVVAVIVAYWLILPAVVLV